MKRLPILNAFAHKLGVVKEIDERIKGEIEFIPKRVVLAMLFDAFSKKSPLFKLYEFFQI